jgi:reactive intermediate/imine deaminase
LLLQSFPFSDQVGWLSKHARQVSVGIEVPDHRCRRIVNALEGFAILAALAFARSLQRPIHDAEETMSKQIIHTERAPAAIGPYSQAVRVDKTVYLSGQIPLQPDSGELVSGDIEFQTRRVFENLQAVAEAAGGGLADIVKLNIYLADLAHFPRVNAVMAEVFGEPYPARAAIGVAALPKGAEVEMDAVLVLTDGA